MNNTPQYFQHPYGYGNPAAQGHAMSQGPSPDYQPNNYLQGIPQNTFQRPSQPFPQQQTQPSPVYPQTLPNHGQIGRGDSHGQMTVGPGPIHSQSPTRNLQDVQFRTNQIIPGNQQISTPGVPFQQNVNSATVPQGQMNPATAQSQVQHTQVQPPVSQVNRNLPPSGTTVSPQSASRERARISVLLEINTHLLQELVSLQAQGKGGVGPHPPQQSPTSPTTTDPSNPLNNSPGDPAKTGGNKTASQEYTDCMRRLQANLSYLAAIADAKKKVNGALPPAPAIMIPPPHLKAVNESYKKLNSLFPEASQSTINKALAMANSQSAKAISSA